jgi:hypothetical protein
MLTALRSEKELGEMAKAGLKAFFRLAALWKLDTEDQRVLLGTQRSTLFHWKKHGSAKLSPDTLERLSYILGIYKALQILLPDPASADAWIKKPNKAPLFAGKSALEFLRQGRVTDLYLVRRYLDAQRGDWY